jgi:hypothetical protein
MAPPPVSGWLDISIEEFMADRRRHLARLYQRYSADSPEEYPEEAIAEITSRSRVQPGKASLS